MARIFIFGVVAATLALGTAGRAGTLLTGTERSSDTDLLTLGNDGIFTPSPQFALLAVSSTQAGPHADLQAALTADSPADPTLQVSNSVNNDTGIDWTSYGVVLSMSVSFSISNGTVSNAGWTTSSVTQPVFNAGSWVGSVVYQEGTTPVAPDDSLGFGYDVTFAGSINYQVNQGFTVNAPSVPEPGTLGLLAAGLWAGAFGWRVRQKRKHAHFA